MPFPELLSTSISWSWDAQEKQSKKYIFSHIENTKIFRSMKIDSLLNCTSLFRKISLLQCLCGNNKNASTFSFFLIIFIFYCVESDFSVAVIDDFLLLPNPPNFLEDDFSWSWHSKISNFYWDLAQ